MIKNILLESRLNDQIAGADLAARYDAIAYASKPVALSHPAHLATVATLFGLDPPAVESCRTLELGCSDGANLIPMAVTLPGATFVGVDLASRPVEAARQTAAELALANVSFLEADLRALPVDFGGFDYIIAHGVYSWVPAPVRDALLALAARHLSPNGVMFVSYNTLPGCHVRRVAWDILHFHTDHIADPQARIDSARALAALLAEPSTASEGSNALLRSEFARLVEMPDSAIFHDDLAVPNDPVYFRDFVAHAARHNLRFLAEAAVSTMSGAGLSPRIRQMIAGLDQQTREQYVDFARFRRFRQSLLCRADSPAALRLSPQRIAGMHVSATTALNRAAAENRPIGPPPAPAAVDSSDAMQALLQWLVEASPQAVAVDDARAWLRNRSVAGGKATARPVEELLLEAFISGTVQLHAAPLPLTTTVDERPVGSPLARWQAQRGDQLTNLRHDLVRIEDAAARLVLRLADGSRNRGQLIDALSLTLPAPDRPTASSRVDYYLQNFAKLALLSPRQSPPHGD